MTKTRGAYLFSMIGGRGWIAGTHVTGWITTCVVVGEVLEDMEEVGLEDIG
jgi:hypothetical protein